MINWFLLKRYWSYPILAHMLNINLHNFYFWVVVVARMMVASLKTKRQKNETLFQISNTFYPKFRFEIVLELIFFLPWKLKSYFVNGSSGECVKDVHFFHSGLSNIWCAMIAGVFGMIESNKMCANALYCHYYWWFPTRSITEYPILCQTYTARYYTYSTLSNFISKKLLAPFILHYFTEVVPDFCMDNLI